MDIFSNQGGLVRQIRARGGCVRVGRTVYNAFKRGGAEKREGETKILKRGGGGGLEGGSRGTCLKNVVGAGTHPFTNYDILI